MRELTVKEQGTGHTEPKSGMTPAEALRAPNTGILTNGEAPLVSDVVSLDEDTATRDQAVVRMGDGPSAAFPTREARPVLLALLLT